MGTNGTGPDVFPERPAAAGQITNYTWRRKKTDLGYIHAGWQQFRKYYDDTGGYDPLLAPSASNLGESLHLDDGRAWIDLGLTLPDWPVLVLGYEYQYRRGDEATTSWGTVTPLGPNILPASENIQEGTQIIKFDATDDIEGTHLEDSFRGEFYSFRQHGTNEFFSDTLQTPESEASAQGYQYFQGANALRVRTAIQRLAFLDRLVISTANWMRRPPPTAA